MGVCVLAVSTAQPVAPPFAAKPSIGARYAPSPAQPKSSTRITTAIAAVAAATVAAVAVAAAEPSSDASFATAIAAAAVGAVLCMQQSVRSLPC